MDFLSKIILLWKDSIGVFVVFVSKYGCPSDQKGLTVLLDWLILRMNRYIYKYTGCTKETSYHPNVGHYRFIN